MKSNFLAMRDLEKQFLDDIWMTADELLGDPTLPTTTAGIHYRAKQEHWRARKREGVKGGKAIEYRLSSISPITRESILASISPKRPTTMTNSSEAASPATGTTSSDGNEELILKLYRSLPSNELRRRFFSRLLVLTSELLDSSEELGVEEIFPESNSDSYTQTATEVSSHGKKAG